MNNPNQAVSIQGLEHIDSLISVAKTAKESVGAEEAKVWDDYIKDLEAARAKFADGIKAIKESCQRVEEEQEPNEEVLTEEQWAIVQAEREKLMAEDEEPEEDEEKEEPSEVTEAIDRALAVLEAPNEIREAFQRGDYNSCRKYLKDTFQIEV